MPAPKTVLSAKTVEMALISYIDENGQEVTQLGVVGDNTIHLLESRSLGINKNQTRQGTASDWLRDAAFKLLGRKVKTTKKEK